jgi:hypothetical protein
MDERFSTNHEEAAYQMLRQVLQNHITATGISFHAALSASGMFIADVALHAYQAGATAGDAQTLMRGIVDALKMHIRLQHEQSAGLTFPELTGADIDIVTDHQLLLVGIWRQFLTEAGDEHAITYDGGYRIALSLSGDLLQVFLHEYDQDLEEVDEYIDTIVSPALMRYIQRSGIYPPESPRIPPR